MKCTTSSVIAHVYVFPLEPVHELSIVIKCTSYDNIKWLSPEISIGNEFGELTDNGLTIDKEVRIINKFKQTKEWKFMKQYYNAPVQLFPIEFK